MPVGGRGDGAGSGGCGMVAVAVVPGRPLYFEQWTVLVWGFLVVLAGQAGAEACPPPCSCLGNTVDCHGLGIHSILKNIPRGTERL